jgi:hypothetical protein
MRFGISDRLLMGSVTVLAVLCSSLALAAPSRENEQEESGLFEPGRAATARTYVDLRGGLSSANALGLGEVCMEVAPLSWLDAETCGTGSGLWRDGDTREMAHFRVELQPYRFVFGGVAFDPQFGVGFAELQVGKDQPGFRFTGSADKFDTSGPEGTASLQAKAPMRYGLELIGELVTGMAYFKDGPVLARPVNALQPFVEFGLGVGF